MRSLIGLGFATLLLAVMGFASRADDSPDVQARTTTIIYTNGLGTFLRDPNGADRARCEAVAKRLKDLRRKYADAIFVDGGDALGPMVANESPFGLPVYRMFDANGYAAAALSARDGVRTFSFFQLLPAGAKVKTPLVGTFDLPKPRLETGMFYEIHPARVSVEVAGTKLQIFGVSTITSLTGIVEPFSDIKTGGSAAAQARYVLGQLLPDHLPIVLSDMSPVENDEFARLLGRNALLFEGGYPWRLISPPANQQPVRDIGPVRILSHLAPNHADVVTLPPSRNFREAKVISREFLWEPRSTPAARRVRLWGSKPIEARLVNSVFTDPLHLPDVGTSVGKRALLQEIMLPYDEKDVQRIPPVSDTSWQPPQWMKDTRHLRASEIVYRYDLLFKKKFIAHVYRVRHLMAPPFGIFDMLVAIDRDHRIQRFALYFPPTVTNRQTRLGSLCGRLIGKKCDEIKLEDWPERGGAEFLVDNFVRDLQLLLAFDEAAE